MNAWMLFAGLLVLLPSAHAVGWRVFVGREDCVSDYLPENQYNMLKESLHKRGEEPPTDMNVVVEAGFLVANKYGGETSKGSVDVWLKNPAGQVVYTGEGKKEDTFQVTAKGDKGPWQLCFRISHNETPQQHALILELSHFTLNLRSLVGTDHERTKGPMTVDVGLGMDVDTESLAKGDELEELKASLQDLAYRLNTIKRQQRYMKLRTDRHFKTVQSTYSTTLWWSFLESSVIVCASLVQVFAVRYLFLSDKALRV